MSDFYTYPERWYAVMGKDTVTIGTFHNCISSLYGRKDCAVLGPFRSANKAQMEAETFKEDI